jgi:hypothetical protein
MAIKGGDKFEREMERMRRGVDSAETVKVGFLSNAKYPDGTPVAMIGAIVLTLRHKGDVKRQDISAQNERDRKTAVELKKIPFRTGV